MILCNVTQLRYGPIVVDFPEFPEKQLFFQSDWDQASFAFSCGLTNSGSPLSDDFVDSDLEDITECPEEYLDLAGPAGESKIKLTLA